MSAIRLALAAASGLLLAGPAVTAAPPPDEAARRMKLADGFTVTAVASEPTVRQPVSMSFDERGRLWVLQYLQYPNYAGLTPVKQDQYLRTVWDKFPEPPPRGPKGLDRLTILYDPDERGVYRKSKDFVAGLNIASGFCVGRGGVYVVQPPYLLFYPDRDQDDVPDGDPDVLLTGFGMDDTHSLANSLQWGPDGWLYGAAGSTSTCKIKNPARPDAPAVEFQQGVWRYHPKTRAFELFSEGGGNTYGLDFDRHGQVIAGTNWGGFAMLHQMQGAYHVKGFSKHGPLHNPHAYGYFDHVPYTGFKGGHVTCGGVVYLGNTFPKEMHDQYVAGNLLSNAVYWHKLEPNGSTFKARHGGDLMTTSDDTFRPVDLMLGPDGSVYVADWTDPRAAHLDPVDNWDKATGRIYKIEYKGTPKLPAFDLRTKSSAELVELLKHPNGWWRKEARRLLADRQDNSVLDDLRKIIHEDQGQLALEALWAVYCLGGFTEFDVVDWLGHANPHIRAWVVRFLGDAGVVETTEAREALAALAWDSGDPLVRAQLACTARRLPAAESLAVLKNLMAQYESNHDPYIPHLIWWALESKTAYLRAGGFKDGPEFGALLSADPTNLFLVERYARRVACHPDPLVRNYFITSVLNPSLIEGAEPKATQAVLRGVEQGLDDSPSFDPVEVREELSIYLKDRRNDEVFLRVAAKARLPQAVEEIGRRLTASDQPEAERARWVPVALGLPKAVPADAWLASLRDAKTEVLRNALLDAVSRGTDPKAVETVLMLYPSWSATVKKKAVGVLLSRPAWALELLKAYDAGAVPKADLGLDHARTAAGLNDPAVTALVEKHWGKVGPATPGEKRARITWLSTMLNRVRPPDVAAGHKLFARQCAACHTLHGEGGKVGPDLTAADRKNRAYMLEHVVDPSGYVRTEFVSHKVTTLDGRTLTGLVAKADAAAVTIVNVVDNKPQETVVARKDIDDLAPQPLSLMPEKLLDTLTYEQVGDLFAYLASDPPGENPGPRTPARRVEGAKGTKELRVGLVSGSLEYKSDESLAAYQAYLEGNFPVECVRMFRKTDTDVPGLDQLETCDVVVFFTRRLKLDGEQLDRVKRYAASGKPVVGVRTASHGFQNWLEMDRLVFGGSYKNHWGQNVPADVRPADAAQGHPILAGVKPFTTLGGLYKNPDNAKDVTVLLTATAQDYTEPVAWVRTRTLAGGTNQRVFYTSLGTPDDFKDPNFIRLLTNGIAWAAGRGFGAK